MTSWLKMPRMPKAATRAVTARTSGTIEATNAPNVMSRMMKVRPIVMNVRSRPSLIRLVMSSFVSVLLTELTVNPEPSVSIAAIAARTGGRRPSTTAWSPVIRPLMRTVVPSGDTSPACGGAVAGSWTSSKTGTVAPFSVTVRPFRRDTMPATYDWYVGSVTWRLGWVTTINTSSVGVDSPPAPKTAYALADSVWAWFGLPFGSSALIPPIAMLRMNTLIVKMNQPANTGQR